MKRRSLIPLSTLFLLLSPRLCPAGDELGLGTQQPVTSAIVLERGLKEEARTGVIDGRERAVLSQRDAATAQPGGQGERIELSLQETMELALKKNLGIRIAALAKEVVRLDVSRAMAKFHPTFGVTFNASGDNSPFTTPGSVAVTEATSQNLRAFIRQEVPTGGTLTLSGNLARAETLPSDIPEEFGTTLEIRVIQPLLRGGRTYVATRPIRDAEFDLRVAEAQLRAEVLRVASRTKSAYYNVLLAERVIEVTEVAIQRDKTLVEASQALFEPRLVTKRDVFSAELSLAQDSARLVNARADLELARTTLLEIIGLPLGTGFFLLDREVSFEPVPLELERWIATAIKNRPEIVDLEERLAKRLLNIKVARNSLLPQLDLTASYGRSQSASTFGKTLDLAGDVWSAGLVLSAPIGNVAATSALAQAEIEYSRLQEQLAQTKRQIELEVRVTVTKLQKSLQRMETLKVAIDQAKGKLEVGKAQFVLGQATNLDITDALQALLNSETDLLTAIVDYNIGLAELEARIGGSLQFQ